MRKIYYHIEDKFITLGLCEKYEVSITYIYSHCIGIVGRKKFVKINSYLTHGQIYFHIFSVENFITIANRESL